MTHILFVTPYYPPEVTPPAIRIHEMARRLVKLGYQVTVLTTFPNFPSGIVPEEYRGQLVRQERHDGVRIVRVWSYVSANRGFLRRIVAQLSFGCLSPLLGGAASGSPDVIVVESPPLFNAIAGRFMAWRKRCPFIFTVADLWPEVAVQMGMLRNRMVIWLARRLEWSTYQQAGLVWVVTDGLRSILVQRGLPPERIFVLTNGVDCTKFYPQSQAQARSVLGWDNRFTILYAGSFGPSHRVATVLDAAEQLLVHSDIHIVLAGDGAEKKALREEAYKRNLTNITFLDVQPHDRIPLLLAASDVCLALASKLILFQGVLPVKMYEAMASARPIILAVNGEACHIAIEEAGAALYAEPENATAFAAAMLYLRDHPAEVEGMGRRGRAYAQMHFDHDQLAARLDRHIQCLLKKSNMRSIELPLTQSHDELSLSQSKERKQLLERKLT
jgi:putative colanic acid biosynthesis glycosyltransferase WcaI